MDIEFWLIVVLLFLIFFDAFFIDREDKFMKSEDEKDAEKGKLALYKWIIVVGLIFVLSVAIVLFLAYGLHVELYFDIGRGSYKRHSVGIDIAGILLFIAVWVYAIYTLIEFIARRHAPKVVPIVFGVAIVSLIVGFYTKYPDAAQRKQLLEEAQKAAQHKAGMDKVHDLGKGIKYQGNLSYGVPHGEGLLMAPDGMTYKGHFRNGVPEGHGIITFKDSKQSIEGKFHDGEPTGVCTIRWQTDKGEKRYVGEVKNYRMHGKGTLYEVDGKVYEGEFRKGLKYGYGTYTYPDGTKVKGVWRDNKFIVKER